MRIGDVIYDNDTVLIASASFNKEEPCKECFFYDGHECQSNRYIECWDKSINKDLIMIPFENNKVQDSKMMDHSSKTVTSKTGKDLLSALSRLSSITGDETNDMADTASRTLFSSLSMLDINKKFLSLGIRLGVKGAAISIHRSLSSNDDVSIKDVIKEIINSEIGIALGLKGAISCIFGSLSKDDCNIKDEIIDISKHIKEKLISDNHG